MFPFIKSKKSEMPKTFFIDGKAALTGADTSTITELCADITAHPDEYEDRTGLVYHRYDDGLYLGHSTACYCTLNPDERAIAQQTLHAFAAHNRASVDDREKVKRTLLQQRLHNLKAARLRAFINPRRDLLTDKPAHEWLDKNGNPHRTRALMRIANKSGGTK